MKIEWKKKRNQVERVALGKKYVYFFVKKKKRRKKIK